MERPIIAGSETVKISIMAKEDLPALWVIDNDPESARYLRFPGENYLQGDMDKLLERLSTDKDKVRIYVILIGSEMEVAGSIGLYSLDWKMGWGYIGYGIGKRFWRRGIMTEAVRLMKEYAFDFMNLRKLITSVMEPNIASRRVLEKNGFSQVGKFTAHGYVPGKGYVNELLFECFNGRFR